MGNWTDQDGWHKEFLRPIVEALRSIPGGGELPIESLYDKAALIEAVANGGKDAEAASNRHATPKASLEELRKLELMCSKLVQHIEEMRGPAVAALSIEGLSTSDLAARLKAAQEVAGYALGNIDFSETGPKGGSPKKVAASDVTEICAVIYEEVRKKPPTFTTDTGNSQISGVWPDFLQAVFNALCIKASVGSQVRAASEKTLKK